MKRQSVSHPVKQRWGDGTNKRSSQKNIKKKTPGLQRQKCMVNEIMDLQNRWARLCSMLVIDN